MEDTNRCAYRVQVDKLVLEATVDVAAPRLLGR